MTSLSHFVPPRCGRTGLKSQHLASARLGCCGGKTASWEDGLGYIARSHVSERTHKPNTVFFLYQHPWGQTSVLLPTWEVHSVELSPKAGGLGDTIARRPSTPASERPLCLMMGREPDKSDWARSNSNAAFFFSSLSFVLFCLFSNHSLERQLSLVPWGTLVSQC